MPSTPLSQDTKVIVAAQTRVDTLALDIAKGRTDMAAAVPALALIVPPARLDLIDEVMARMGRGGVKETGWPPPAIRYELATKLKAVHAGELCLTTPDGINVRVRQYRDTMQTERLVYRVDQDGRLVGEAKDAAALAKLVDVTALREGGRPKH